MNPPSRSRLAFISGGIMLVALLSTSCGGDMPGFGPTITAEQAKAQTERHVSDVAAAVFPDASLTIDTPMELMECNDPVDRGPLGRVITTVAYRITNFPAERNAAAFDAALRYWNEHDFKVLSQTRQPDHNYIDVEAPDPDFTTIALKESSDSTRTLFLVASSPCVWPDGKPAPRT